MDSNNKKNQKIEKIKHVEVNRKQKQRKEKHTEVNRKQKQRKEKHTEVNRKQKQRKESKLWTEGQRVRAVFIVVGILFLIVIGRIVHVQLIMGGTLKSENLSLRQTKEVIKAKRGSILDANGEELAVDSSVYSLWVDANQFRAQLLKKNINKNVISQELSKALSQEGFISITPEEVLQKIEQNSGFVWIKKKLSFQEVEAVKKLGYSALVFQEESRRHYPKNFTCGNLIGFVNDSGVGAAGVESSYDDILSGIDGLIEGQKDGKQNFLQDTTNTIRKPIDGKNIQLTIDLRVQHIVDKEINKIISELNPQKVSIIVMKIKTGEILGIGDSNIYDPNNFREINSALFSVKAFQEVYEPGSTMKPIMAASAINEGVVTPQTGFYDNGFRIIDDYTIRCWIYPNSHGYESLTDGMANSCNPVFMDTAKLLRDANPKAWYKYLDKFGFGKKTAVNFNGEASGILPENNAYIFHATSAIGQGISASPIQMATAISAIGNKGRIVEPKLIKSINSSDGKVLEEKETVFTEQVISEEAAFQTMKMMRAVVERPNATGISGNTDNVESVAKTGTAEKSDISGKYIKDKYIISFIGMAPYSDPEFTVSVIIDEPTKGCGSSSSVGPYYKSIMEELIKTLATNNVTINENIATTAINNEAIMPDLTGMTISYAKNLLKEKGIILEEDEEGNIVSQSKKAGEKIETGSIVTVKIEDKGLIEGQVVMVDFNGLRLPDVVARKETIGIKIEISGTGKVVSQNVPPGTIFNQSDILQLKFAE